MARRASSHAPLGLGVGTLPDSPTESRSGEQSSGTVGRDSSVGGSGIASFFRSIASSSRLAASLAVGSLATLALSLLYLRSRRNANQQRLDELEKRTAALLAKQAKLIDSAPPSPTASDARTTEPSSPAGSPAASPVSVSVSSLAPSPSLLSPAIPAHTSLSSSSSASSAYASSSSSSSGGLRASNSPPGFVYPSTPAVAAVLAAAMSSSLSPFSTPSAALTSPSSSSASTPTFSAVFTAAARARVLAVFQEVAVGTGLADRSSLLYVLRHDPLVGPAIDVGAGDLPPALVRTGLSLFTLHLELAPDDVDEAEVERLFALADAQAEAETALARDIAAVLAPLWPKEASLPGYSQQQQQGQQPTYRPRLSPATPAVPPPMPQFDSPLTANPVSAIAGPDGSGATRREGEEGGDEGEAEEEEAGAVVEETNVFSSLSAPPALRRKALLALVNHPKFMGRLAAPRPEDALLLKLVGLLALPAAVTDSITAGAGVTPDGVTSDDAAAGDATETEDAAEARPAASLTTWLLAAQNALTHQDLAVVELEKMAQFLAQSIEQSEEARLESSDPTSASSPLASSLSPASEPPSAASAMASLLDYYRSDPKTAPFFATPPGPERDAAQLLGGVFGALTALLDPLIRGDPQAETAAAAAATAGVSGEDATVGLPRWLVAQWRARVAVQTALLRGTLELQSE